jgi:hypothetical protein
MVMPCQQGALRNLGGGGLIGEALGDESSGGLVWLLDTAALIKGAGWGFYTAMIDV